MHQNLIKTSTVSFVNLMSATCQCQLPNSAAITIERIPVKAERPVQWDNQPHKMHCKEQPSTLENI